MTSTLATGIVIGIFIGLLIAVALAAIALRWVSTRKWGGK